MTFRKNLHRSKRISLIKIEQMIASYPRQYSTPKYMIFIKEMLALGWKVRLYQARVSKYVFVIRGNLVRKIRFSNHKPLFLKEMEEDCDYYVGITHKQVSTTEKIIQELIKLTPNEIS